MWVKVMPGVYEGHPVSSVDQETLEIRIKLSRVPLGTQETHRFATWHDRSGLAGALETAKGFVKSIPDHHFLTFIGQPGVGKTHLAVATLWEWLESSLGNGCYWQVGALLDHLRSFYRRHQKGEELDLDAELHWLQNCGLLVLDDLGAEKQTEWSTEKLDEIVDYRYLNKKWTVFTTNLTDTMLPPRIVDRMMEGCVVKMLASSYRRQKK